MSRRLQNEMVRGHRIMVPNDHMGSGTPLAQNPMVRNGPLPPIGHMERETSENNISVTLERVCRHNSRSTCILCHCVK